MRRLVVRLVSLGFSKRTFCISSTINKKMGVELNNEKIEAMRLSYDVSKISDEVEIKDPIELFKSWFDEAVEHEGIQEPNAMNLATCTKDGFPANRIVLLKGVAETGFKFYTNYESEKGRHLEENPRAAITFYWEPLQKQIRINGNVEKLSDEESTEYFHKRPFVSQIGAMTSRQSTVIPNRQYLEIMKEELTKKYEGKVIPKPEYWGGYLVKPVTMEFWCGGQGRLHDRIRFRYPVDSEKFDSNLTKEGAKGWVYERLSP